MVTQAPLPVGLEPALDMPGAAPLVYVLICNYNGKRWLDECLRSVLALDYPNFAVVVVENGSADGSAEHIRRSYPSVQLIELARNRGYAGGMNVGLAYAAARGAEYFLIMNNDTIIAPDALAALVATARTRPRAGTVTGKVYYYDHPDVFQTVGKSEHPLRLIGDHIGGGQRDERQFEAVAERALVDGVYCLVDRRLYDEVGGHDAGLFYMAEEADWQLRAKAHGWRIYYTPAARLWHRVSMTAGGSGNPAAQYFFARNSLVVLYRHGGALRFARCCARLGWEATWGLLKGLAQLKAAKIRPRLALWLGLWAGALWPLHRRPATGVPRAVRLLCM